MPDALDEISKTHWAYKQALKIAEYAKCEAITNEELVSFTADSLRLAYHTGAVDALAEAKRSICGEPVEA